VYCNTWDKLESLLYKDSKYSFGGGTIYSYLNYPDRNTGTLTVDWKSATGKQIISDVMSMKQASMDNYHYGPWLLKIPAEYETILDEDYSDAKGANTIRERILQINGIQDIIVVDTMANGNVILVQTDPSVIRIVRGMGLTNVQWQTEGNFVNKYKVMTIQVPQIRSDHNGKTGVVHFAAPASS